MRKTYTALIASALALTSCNHLLHKQLQPTVMAVKDSIRHYYPVILGDEVSIECEITNKGNEPLAITDIQPSNFSIELNSPTPGIIPPGKTEYINFIFHTEKNVGYAQHTIRFFGNILPDGVASLTFDTHIVRPTIDHSDYEEVYLEKKHNSIEELIDGNVGQKGYWIDGSQEDSAYQRTYKKYLIY